MKNIFKHKRSNSISEIFKEGNEFIYVRILYSENPKFVGDVRLAKKDEYKKSHLKINDNLYNDLICSN